MTLHFNHTTLPMERVLELLAPDIYDDVLAYVDDSKRAGDMPAGAGFDHGIPHATTLLGIHVYDDCIEVDWQTEVDESE